MLTPGKLDKAGGGGGDGDGDMSGTGTPAGKRDEREERGRGQGGGRGATVRRGSLLGLEQASSKGDGGQGLEDIGAWKVEPGVKATRYNRAGRQPGRTRDKCVK